MWTRTAVALALFAGVGLAALPGVAGAQDCQTHVRSTETSLKDARAEAADASDQVKPRAEGFLNDAQRLLDAARAECERAVTPLDHSFVIAKVLVAQGNIAAAKLLIKAQ